MVYFTPVVALLAAATAVSGHWRDSCSVNSTEIHMTGTHLAGRATTQQQYLDAHNTERAAHGAAALTWDAGTLGQNLAAGTGNPSIATEVGWWNNERSDYNPSNPQPSHWTQVVWKGTTKVGCYLATCAPGTILDASYGSASYVVCNYSPAGNVIGQFPQNVQK
ncbi:hypothetical protein FRC12_010498 [Ceratobasidium sp. 428]|nr:hypothetical protein FRC12_010498 [Ceratobasidium sp. 428]